MLALVLLAVPVALILTLLGYLPQMLQLFQALRSLVDAIRNRNSDKGKAAVGESMQIALDVTLGLRARGDLSEEAKREQAWKDIQYAAKVVGIELTESQARTLAELAYQKARS